ncbi:MAG TPA: hypothetical protein VF491_04195 [Vicinamibacterales bacterium]
MDRRPPRLASLLLDRLAPGNDPLRGDLEEEYARGRTSGWYWRQVFAAIAQQGPLAVRARGLVAAENFVTGIITLVLIGFYAVFVVNVTDWLLRFEGVRVWEWVPNALGPFNGVASILTFALGLATGRWVRRRARADRVALIVAFGGATMLCASVALKAVSLSVNSDEFLPGILSQVGMTAPFVIGLIGGVSGAGFRPPVVMLGIMRQRA